MNIKTIKHFAIIVGTSLIVMSCFKDCNKNNSSSGSSSEGGNSSGGSGNTIQYNATYEFESVNLEYDFSGASNGLNNISIDAGEFYQFHGTDPTKTQGTITNLYNIIENVDFVEENSRKPKIEVTIKPSYGGGDIVHTCSVEDVGSNYVQNLPNIGPNINSIIVKIESITTQANNLRLIWSKTFDLNQQWWESVEDTALSGEAEVRFISYTKIIGGNTILLLRPTGDGCYTIISCVESNVMTNGVVECDIEFIKSNIVNPPGLDRPIFVGGQLVDSVEWVQPLAAQLVDNE